MNEYVKLKDYDRVPAAWGFAQLKVTSSLLKGHKINNVTISLLSSLKGSGVKTESTALPVALTQPGFPVNPAPKAPQGETLTIALPVALGTVFLLVVGLCIWNRKTRRIQLGNVMGRGQRGYTGRRARGRMMARKDPGIRLNAHPLSPARVAADHPDYTDEAPRPGVDRRDSDGLGSLAGSPVDETFQQQGSTGSNAFRDEIERQRREEQGGMF